jgi:hypothetical protein
MQTKHFFAVAVLAGLTSSALAQQLQAPRPSTFEGQSAHDKGPLTRDEFLNRASERFDRLDANKDGKLTPDERRPERQYRWNRPARPQLEGPGPHVGHPPLPSPGK